MEKHSQLNEIYGIINRYNKSERKHFIMNDYIKREQELLTKLHKTNYAMFDGDKAEALDFVASQLEKFPNYANIVIQQQIMQPIWYNRFEGQELRDHIEGIDSNRRIAHESAIASVNILNRTCSKLGLDKFADIDTTDRHAVADFVGQYVNQLYNNGIGNNFDSATYQKSTQYDSKQVKRHISEIESKLNNIADNCQAQTSNEQNDINYELE